MKKYTSFLTFLVLLSGLVLYMIFMTPSISKPGSLAGFFVAFMATMVSFLYLLLSGMKSAKKRYIWSGVLAGLTSYLVALSSLGAFSLGNVSIAIFVASALLFVVDRSQL